MHTHLLRGIKLASVSFCVLFLFLSVGASQLFAPASFAKVGIQKNASLPFLRAAVQLGDRYLIKQVFPESLLSQYPVVLDTYIREDEMLRQIETIEKRAPESRDIFAAKIVLYERMGETQKAEEYRAKLKQLDPSYEIAALEEQ